MHVGMHKGRGWGQVLLGAAAGRGLVLLILQAGSADNSLHFAGPRPSSCGHVNRALGYGARFSLERGFRKP